MIQFGCVPNASPVDSGKASVVVSIEPQKFFVSEIVGDKIDVEVLVPTGKEPETYVPTPEQIKKLSKCRIFFRVGFPTEETFLPKLKTLIPGLQVVDTRDGIAIRNLDAHAHHDHDHNHDVHSGADPHIWLSPSLVKQQLRHIVAAIVELDPENKGFYEKNAEKFANELDDAITEITEILAVHQGETIYVFHPAYGYFCDEFGLKQKAIELDGKSPKPQELAKLIQQAKADGVKTILVQPEFNPAPAEKIATEIGAKAVVHSPLGSNYVHDLIELAKVIANNR